MQQNIYLPHYVLTFFRMHILRNLNLWSYT